MWVPRHVAFLEISENNDEGTGTEQDELIIPPTFNPPTLDEEIREHRQELEIANADEYEQKESSESLRMSSNDRSETLTESEDKEQSYTEILSLNTQALYNFENRIHYLNMKELIANLLSEGGLSETAETEYDIRTSNALITQVGSGNSAEISNTMGRNSLTVNQDGTNNQVIALQDGEFNKVFLNQVGEMNSSELFQYGDNNAINVDVIGNLHRSEIMQEGFYNRLDIDSGSSTIVIAEQKGDDNRAELNQDANSDIKLIQDGFENSMVIEQRKEDNSVDAEQIGDRNLVQVIQNSERFESKIVIQQNGSWNINEINQSGFGSTFTTQTGNYNNASINQDTFMN